MTADTQERWQHSSSDAEFFELYQVPGLFGPMAQRLLEYVPLRPGHRVLDVACGTGIVARLAAPLVAPSGRIVGLDLNEVMLAVAREHAPDVGIPIDWKQGDATALPFGDGEFDAVLCQQGLQFFPDIVAALREMRRVATAGGTIALAVFGQASRFNTALAEALAERVSDHVARRSLAPYALGDSAVLRALMGDAAFSEIEIRTIVLTRRVHPTQEWLLQYSGSTPYSAAIANLEPAVRAEIVREIAAKLKGFWDGASFAVPSEVYLAYARS